MARTRSELPPSWLSLANSGRSRVLGRVQLALDALIAAAAMLLAAAMQPELRRVFPPLRAAAAFREHALLVYLM